MSLSCWGALTPLGRRWCKDEEAARPSRRPHFPSETRSVAVLRWMADCMFSAAELLNLYKLLVFSSR